jgi:hypothetical protein
MNKKTVVQLRLGEGTIRILDELAASLESVEGAKVARTRVICLAVAAMRKRMADEGMLIASGTEAKA